jgi:hypothetical protein
VRPRFTGNVVEAPAHVQNIAAQRQREDRAVGIRGPRVYASIRADVSQVPAPQATDTRKAAADVPAARAVGNSRSHSTSDTSIWTCDQAVP